MIAVLVPCFKRPEYTKMCMDALVVSQSYPNVHFYLVDDGSQDGTEEILRASNLAHLLTVHKEPTGLRNVIIEFFNQTKHGGYTYLAKMDNDCVVPKDWITKLVEALEKSGSDVVSPNVAPSNAAFVYGREGDCELVRPSEIVGGLWCMRARLLDGISFESFGPNGISGAFNVIKQIILESEAKVAWVPGVTVGDIGHWSGQHPDHIKSESHQEYSAFVGRPISWGA